MKAAFYDRQGAARDVLVVADLPDPRAGRGEVRVRVAFSGLNPTDIKTRSGFAGKAMPYARITPHQDGSGVIDQVGEGVPASRLGERVWVYEAQTGRATGTAAQYVVVPTANAVALPHGAALDIAACLGIPAMTAHRCLFADGDIRGLRVLVHGGAGAVGTSAILLAKWAGAWVAATVSRPEQEEVARRAGADLIIYRRTEDVAARLRHAVGDAGIDRIVDVDLVANIDINLACLAINGVVSAYATENPAASLSFPFHRAMLRGLVFRCVFVYAMSEQAHTDAVRDINACLADDAYRPAIGLRLALGQIVAAHEAQEAHGVVGKILVDCGGR